MNSCHEEGVGTRIEAADSALIPARFRSRTLPRSSETGHCYNVINEWRNWTYLFHYSANDRRQTTGWDILNYYDSIPRWDRVRQDRVGHLSHPGGTQRDTLLTIRPPGGAG
eukprot:gene25977-biopygen12501